MEFTYAVHYPMSACDPPEALTAPIDWHKEMRKCVGDAAELADHISTSDSDVGGALGRLCLAVTHLLDENKALAERLRTVERESAENARALVQVFTQGED